MHSDIDYVFAERRAFADRLVPSFQVREFFPLDIQIEPAKRNWRGRDITDSECVARQVLVI